MDQGTHSLAHVFLSGFEAKYDFVEFIYYLFPGIIFGSIRSTVDNEWSAVFVNTLALAQPLLERLGADLRLAGKFGIRIVWMLSTRAP
ncbi:MAG: hypothetical protein H0X43_12670 [Nitrosospira sp.]|nr:hypothetical protein [Nitrosospira sp.]